MRYLYLIRYGAVLLALLGWILFQLFYKKKSWNEIKNDAMVILIFVVIAFAIFYFVFN